MLVERVTALAHGEELHVRRGEHDEVGREHLHVPLADLSAAGLPAPSVVRLKIFTLDDRLVERRVGALGPPDASAVQGALGRLFGGRGG